MDKLDSRIKKNLPRSLTNHLCHCNVYYHIETVLTIKGTQLVLIPTATDQLIKFFMSETDKLNAKDIMA